MNKVKYKVIDYYTGEKVAQDFDSVSIAEKWIHRENKYALKNNITAHNFLMLVVPQLYERKN